jgi:hypothetical protein
MIRGIGPSLNVNGDGVRGRVEDPTLELFDSNNELVEFNDNWRDSNEQEKRDTGIAPSDDREPSIMRRLNPGSYTAVLRGARDSGGIGLVEIFDLDSSPNSTLANISTRGDVGIDDDVLIGGVIVRGGGAQKIIVRAIGPDLSNRGVSGVLEDPTIELFDNNGGKLADNDDWMSSQRQEIEDTGLAPRNEREAAIVRTVPAGDYTAIVSGKNGATGVALVEVYNLGNP